MNTHFHLENFIPSGDHVWVFGSDEGGRHSKGASKIAHVNFRAAYGCNSGPTGRAYAIPVCDKQYLALPIEAISQAVANFLAYAKAQPKLNFFVTRIGYAEDLGDEVIASMFADVPENCSLPAVWKLFVGGVVAFEAA